MTVPQPGIQVVENPIGKGRGFNRGHLIAEVIYELQVLQNSLSEATSPVPIITGKISRIDHTNILWDTELLTLHLEDKRKLDFLCVNYDPECNIASNSGFYI